MSYLVACLLTLLQNSFSRYLAIIKWELTYFFHQTLNQCFSYIMSKEKKNHKIWPLKVYSNLKLPNGTVAGIK